MKKLIFFMLFVTCIGWSTNAQDINSGPHTSDFIDVYNSLYGDVEVITVLRLKGKAKYSKPGKKKFKKIKEGSILDKKGTVKLKKKAELTLLDNGKTKQLNTKGKHALSDLQAVMIAGNDDFLDFLTSVSGFGGPGGGGHEDSTGRGGGGGEGLVLIGLQPMPGKVPANTVTFSWSGKSASGYTFNLYAMDNKSEPVFSQKSNANSLSLNLADIKGISYGKSYTWQVEMESNGITRKTGRTKINIEKDDGSTAKIMQKTMASKAYASATGWEKSLRAAKALEDSGYNSEAAKKYQEARNKYPKNEMVKSAHLLFKEKMRAKNEANQKRY